MATSIRQFLFPYGMNFHDDGSVSFFNRDYLKLGADKEASDNPDRIRLRGLGPMKRAALDCKGDGSGDTIWFYDDGCIPGSSVAATEAYYKKLNLLMNLKKD